MPKKKNPTEIKITALEVQKSRADWYAFHFENRARIRTMAKEEVYTYQRVAQFIPEPEMTVFGGLKADYPERSVYELSNQWHLDVNLVNPWYLTDEGWEKFQRLWKNLPEPVDIYQTKSDPDGVQIGEIVWTVAQTQDLIPR